MFKESPEGEQLMLAFWGGAATAPVEGAVATKTALLEVDMHVEEAKRLEAEVSGAEEGAKKSKGASAYPKFVPAVRFGETVQRYEGKLYLSRLQIFKVTANRQRKGHYAVSGMVAMIDPSTGRLMQETGDRKKEIYKRRADKGCIPVSHKGSYITAIKHELNVRPQKNPNYTKAVQTTAIDVAQQLLRDHIKLTTERTLHGVPIEQMDLSTIFDGYGSAYLHDRTKSENSRRKYKGLICGVVDVFGDLELGKWAKGVFTRKEKEHKAINAESMKEVRNFLDYVAKKRRISNPVADCLEEYLAEKGKKRMDPEESQKEATKSVWLCSEVEKFLDQECWENLKDPRYAFIMLAKEGGLTVEAACGLKIKDICRDSENMQKVFVNFRRDDLKSATHDYTFPLFPCGAVYINAYLDELAKTYGADRVSGNCYMLSEDPSGKEKCDAKKLKDFINELLSHHKMGYAALAGLEGKTKKSRGSFLLHKTYEDRLNQIFCDPGRKKKDDGAVTFMMHRSLVKSVQTDHYRAFTDFTGRNYLYESLCNDKRNPMQYLGCEKPRNRRKSRKKNGEITYPAGAGNHGQILEITVKGLEAGDEVCFEALHGLLVSVILPS